MVLAKEKIFTEESIYLKFLKRITQRKLCYGENSARLLTTFTQKNDGWCSNMQKLTLIFEYHERSLE
jgi:hypothetical protein